jgi:hypothetical protein
VELHGNISFKPANSLSKGSENFVSTYQFTRRRNLKTSCKGKKRRNCRGFVRGIDYICFH